MKKIALIFVTVATLANLGLTHRGARLERRRLGLGSRHRTWYRKLAPWQPARTASMGPMDLTAM
jgi:hypothetical protein